MTLGYFLLKVSVSLFIASNLNLSFTLSRKDGELGVGTKVRFDFSSVRGKVNGK